MFVCFHAGGLRSQISLTRIPPSLCWQAVPLCLSLPLSRNMPHCPTHPGPPCLLLLLLPGDSTDWNTLLLFLPSPRYALGTAMAALLKVPLFAVSALLDWFQAGSQAAGVGTRDSKGRAPTGLLIPPPPTAALIFRGMVYTTLSSLSKQCLEPIAKSGLTWAWGWKPH